MRTRSPRTKQAGAVKVRYKFTGHAGGRYYWQSVLPVAPGDSRYEQISCPDDWFWSDAR